MNEPPIVRDKVEARQGSKSLMSSRVLMTSMALIVLIFVGFYIAFVLAPRSSNDAPIPAPQAQQPAAP